MRAIAPLLTLPLLLAACDIETNSENGDNVHISIGTKDGDKEKVSVAVPGFNANVNLSGFNLGTHMDFDGVKLAPDTSVKGMDVFGDDKGGNDDKGNGQVHVAFTNPKDTAAVLDYYTGALKGAGYAIATTSAGGIEANKDDKTFSLKISPEGSGSKGTITITGD